MKSIITESEHDYNKIRGIIGELSERYPFLSVSSLGHSVAGRSIYSLSLGSPKNCVLLAGAFHGSERLTAVLLLKFLEELCEGVKNSLDIAGISARSALRDRGLTIIPMVNPDGCEISLNGAAGCGQHAGRIRRLCGGDFEHWNANLRGVDINHNFNAGFEILRQKESEIGIFGPSMTRFGGWKPESEPETIALTSFCREHSVRHVTAVHSQGEVIYWNYGKNTPTRSKRMAEILAASSGYALDVPMGISSGGGFKDWFIQEFSKPGFTIEVGKGKNPLPSENLFEIYLRVKEMFMLLLLM